MDAAGLGLGLFDEAFAQFFEVVELAFVDFEVGDEGAAGVGFKHGCLGGVERRRVDAQGLVGSSLMGGDKEGGEKGEHLILMGYLIILRKNLGIWEMKPQKIGIASRIV